MKNKNKRKVKKQRIQEQQKQPTTTDPILGALKQARDLARASASAHLQDLRSLQREHGLLAKRAEDLERKLKGQEKLTTDMHNNHVQMRLALSDIRDLHMPEGEDCRECGRPWPCTTYSRIKMPDQVAITGLILIEQQLRENQ